MEAMKPYIKHVSDLQRYAPPGHYGTENVRLVEKDFNGAFEMILGTLAPGAEAHRHAHETETQICYVIEGEMEVTFGSEPPVTCPAGTVVGIPPKLDHHFLNSGDSPLKLIVLYSPPLKPREERLIHA